MGRGGVADTTSLLNLGEEHLTFMREWASSFLKPLEHQTAFLVLPREGNTLKGVCLRAVAFPPSP
jgi:hypothetical protein